MIQKILKQEIQFSKNSLLSNVNIYDSDLNRAMFESSEIKNAKFQNCKMFMFIGFNTIINDVIFDSSNLTLSKFINCKKTNSPLLKNNKLLCVFEKNVIEDHEKLI